jgi:hypothetical protein
MSKWIFFNTPSKQALSSSEVRYWKTNLDRILKAGIEFEFNLPSNKGACKGNITQCPCVKFTKDYDCWQKCANYKECCATYGKEHIANMCAYNTCTNFVSACSNCDEREVNCEQCSFLYDPNADPDNIRQTLRDELSPSHSYGKINSSGVHSITTDGSLLGSGEEGKGVEVITTGRRVDYWEFFKMNKAIIEKSHVGGAYVNERCSIHVHLLASYYDMKMTIGKSNGASELERPVPQIVLANFHQLCRKYQNAITWMSMALTEKEHLTRWEKYRASILNISPVKRTMRQVRSIIEQRTGKSGGKYGWVNYMFMRFDDNIDITRFHLEMRVMDGNMSASAVTALTCLFYSLVIKAVELSRYGLLEVGSVKEADEAQEIKSKLLNNNPDGWHSPHRFSETQHLDEKTMEILTMQSLELLYQTKHILNRLGPAYDVLEQLAYKPIAFRRMEGLSWEAIEKELAVYVPTETIVEKLLFASIDTREFISCKTEEEWTTKVIASLEKEEEGTKELIADILQEGKNNGEFVWSANIGTMLKV